MGFEQTLKWKGKLKRPCKWVLWANSIYCIVIGAATAESITGIDVFVQACTMNAHKCQRGLCTAVCTEVILEPSGKVQKEPYRLLRGET